MEARPSKEKTELVEEKRKKPAMTKEVTKSLSELKELPNEILVKIFNFLPNHDIRCGVSLACKKFKEICQDESLVPVKDLCIYGDKKNGWKLKDIGAVSDIIVQSKNLTSLKIKALEPNSRNHLVTIALQACPKLIHLEIFETPEMRWVSEMGKYFECKILKYLFREI